MRKLSELTVLIRSGGEVASAVAHRLHRAHFRVVITEVEHPLAVSRGTAFSEAVFDGSKTIEGVTAVLTPVSLAEIQKVWKEGKIPLLIDPPAAVKKLISPDVLVDAIMSKKNTTAKITDAPLVIGLGPGFDAGREVHLVVETNHSNNLGRVILEGEAEKDTGTPVAIAGLSKERVVWAPRAGVFRSERQIGSPVAAGETIGGIDDLPLTAPVSGMLRGLLRSGVPVSKGAKLIEVDPVNDPAVCWVIRDKMRAIAGGVLEAILMRCNT